MIYRTVSFTSVFLNASLFSDAFYIDKTNSFLNTHPQKLPLKDSVKHCPFNPLLNTGYLKSVSIFCIGLITLKLSFKLFIELNSLKQLFYLFSLNITY